MTDVGATIAPKSDQLNSDDLISGPMTVTITKVAGNEGTPEQPINIFFEGDNGKPYRPCKSMRRVMVAVWGRDGHEYVGRSMTLYRDPEVMFGGLKVGGTRISHMSHIDKPITMALTATRANRKPFTVQPLKMQAPAKPAEPEPPAETVDYVSANGDIEPTPLDMAIRKMRAAHKSPKLDNDAWFDLYQANQAWLDDKAPDVAAELAVRGDGA
jgi:hypothetical protein